MKPPQIKVAALIDAVQQAAEFPIRFQQLIAGKELDRAGQVRQFQVAPRDRVPHVTHREKSPDGDDVQEFLNHLQDGNTFGNVLRNQADLFERLGRVGSQSGPHLTFGGFSGFVQQLRKLSSFEAGKPGRNQSASSAAQMLRHQHFTLVRQCPFDRLPSERKRPGGHINCVDLPLVIDADFLQVVEEFFVGVPESLAGVDQQTDQRAVPCAGILVIEPQRFLQSPDEPLDVGECSIDPVTDEFRRGESRRLHLRECGADRVAACKGAVRFSNQTRKRTVIRFGIDGQRLQNVLIQLREKTALRRARLVVACPIGQWLLGQVSGQTVEFIGQLITFRRRFPKSFGAVRQPRSLEKAVEINVVANQIINGLIVGERRKIGRQTVRCKKFQFAVERRKLDILQRRVGLNEMLTSQDTVNFVEFNLSQFMNPLAEVCGGQRLGFAKPVEFEVNPRVEQQPPDVTLELGQTHRLEVFVVRTCQQDGGFGEFASRFQPQFVPVHVLQQVIP